MNIATLKNVYFIGIGGIGMSAIARYFKSHGVPVSGYDRTPTPLTATLQDEGITVQFEDAVDRLDREAELVIYTPAIPETNSQLSWYRENGYTVIKRSDALQAITQSLEAVTVAGTHGKTTISTMIAFLLRETGYGCNAFLGGIALNYNTNYWSSLTPTAVIEADEYDRSFLKLHPDLALLTSTDADHLDIYGTPEAMEDAFVAYTGNVKPNGTLLYKHGLSLSKRFQTPNQLTYALQNDAADVYGANIVQKDGAYHFDVFGTLGVVSDIYLPIGGMHNVENAVAATAAALKLGVAPAAIAEAFPKFQGIRRRFEYVVRNEQHVYIDDYAHHPEELTALIKSARHLFPERRCVVAFQPHLFSRTRDLADGFAAALDLADEVLLLDIYPARELPIPGVTTQLLADRMSNPAVTILSKEGLLEYVQAAKPALFITAGAGDIDTLVSKIKSILQPAVPDGH
ncbi:MAG: UDP-N-acetylmuramate--L-alanine ligase [Sphingobacteriales bacterium]|nr:MAG: UDP-N-acetylmuramate--L-alanine ligase [Sphingobacteriales bacterium]